MNINTIEKINKHMRKREESGGHMVGNLIENNAVTIAGKVVSTLE